MFLQIGSCLIDGDVHSVAARSTLSMPSQSQHESGNSGREAAGGVNFASTSRASPWRNFCSFLRSRHLGSVVRDCGLWGLPYMTSAKNLDLLTPSPSSRTEISADFVPLPAFLGPLDCGRGRHV